MHPVDRQGTQVYTMRTCTYAHLHAPTFTSRSGAITLYWKPWVHTDSPLASPIAMQQPCSFSFFSLSPNRKWLPSPLMDQSPGNDLTLPPRAEASSCSGDSPFWTSLPPPQSLIPMPGHPSGNTLLSLLGLCHPAWMPSPTSDSL